MPLRLGKVRSTARAVGLRRQGAEAFTWDYLWSRTPGAVLLGGMNLDTGHRTWTIFLVA